MPELNSGWEIQQRPETDEFIVVVFFGIKAYRLHHMSQTHYIEGMKYSTEMHFQNHWSCHVTDKMNTFPFESL